MQEAQGKGILKPSSPTVADILNSQPTPTVTPDVSKGPASEATSPTKPISIQTIPEPVSGNISTGPDVSPHESTQRILENGAPRRTDALTKTLQTPVEETEGPRSLQNVLNGMSVSGEKSDLRFRPDKARGGYRVPSNKVIVGMSLVYLISLPLLQSRMNEGSGRG